MLYLTSKKGIETQHHIGNPLPKINDAAEIQADGDELEKILNQTENFPYHIAKRVQKWRGDLAQFIVDNVDFSK